MFLDVLAETPSGYTIFIHSFTIELLVFKWIDVSVVSSNDDLLCDKTCLLHDTHDILQLQLLVAIQVCDLWSTRIPFGLGRTRAARYTQSRRLRILSPDWKWVIHVEQAVLVVTRRPQEEQNKQARLACEQGQEKAKAYRKSVTECLRV